MGTGGGGGVIMAMDTGRGGEVTWSFPSGGEVTVEDSQPLHYPQLPWAAFTLQQQLCGPPQSFGGLLPLISQLKVK